MDGSMSVCPYCDNPNIEGVDVCDQCGQPLDDLHLPNPSTLVERSLLKDRVSVLDPKKPVSVPPNAKTAEVLQTLVDCGIGCVLIVKDNALIGIFSERDALLRINDQAVEFGKRPISDFMTPAPQTLQLDAKIAFAVQMMDLGGYRHVPVVDADNRPVGIISVRDILRYLTDKMTTLSSA